MICQQNSVKKTRQNKGSQNECQQMSKIHEFWEFLLTNERHEDSRPCWEPS